MPFESSLASDGLEYLIPISLLQLALSLCQLFLPRWIHSHTAATCRRRYKYCSYSKHTQGETDGWGLSESEAAKQLTRKINKN